MSGHSPGDDVGATGFREGFLDAGATGIREVLDPAHGDAASKWHAARDWTNAGPKRSWRRPMSMSYPVPAAGRCENPSQIRRRTGFPSAFPPPDARPRGTGPNGRGRQLATIRCWPPVPTPASCCMSAWARDRPTPPAAPSDDCLTEVGPPAAPRSTRGTTGPGHVRRSPGILLHEEREVPPAHFRRVSNSSLGAATIYNGYTRRV
jgi:hypothetical protein